MSDFDRNLATARSGYGADQVAIDAGLRAYMIRVYNYMAAGVALTGLVAWFAFSAAVVDTGAGEETVSVALVSAGVGDTILVHAREAIAVVGR